MVLKYGCGLVYPLAKMKRRKQRKLMAFDSPWTLDAATVRIFHPGDGDQDAASRRLRSGEHRTPFMLETEFERQLLFTRTRVQSTMSIDSPDALVSHYTQAMMSFLLFRPEPRHILMIGVGGGSLAKFCYRHLPAAQVTAVEIDADVIALREEFLIPPDDERFRIVHDDGARFIMSFQETTDVLLVDAFDAGGLAPTLLGSNFYSTAATRLAPQGVLVLNLSGERSRFTSHLMQLRAAFAQPLMTLPIATSDNILVFAFKSPVPTAATADLIERAQRLEEALSLEFPRYLQRLYTRRNDHTDLFDD